jgi:GntR family transcriptional regulator, transcriptional repressor for pyruvate dehydrogenase complex
VGVRERLRPAGPPSRTSRGTEVGVITFAIIQVIYRTSLGSFSCPAAYRKRLRVVSEFFPQVTRDPSLADKVAALMLETITSNSLRPGDSLPSERELGEQFGVSRTVVREAVRSLVAKGLIEVRTGSGIRVASMDGSSARESLAHFLRLSDGLDYAKVHEIRSVLEVQMAASAAERANQGDLRALSEACRKMTDVGNDVDQASRADIEFHRALANATHNPLYVVLLDAIGDALIEVRQQTLLHGGLSSALRSHREIFEAVKRGDAAGAREAMSAHLETVERLWTNSRRSLLDSARPWLQTPRGKPTGGQAPS